jgi:hypothetical protein
MRVAPSPHPSMDDCFLPARLAWFTIFQPHMAPTAAEWQRLTGLSLHWGRSDGEALLALGMTTEHA